MSGLPWFWYDARVKPHPKIRMCTQWAGTACCAALLAAWLISGWTHPSRDLPLNWKDYDDVDITLSQGRIMTTLSRTREIAELFLIAEVDISEFEALPSHGWRFEPWFDSRFNECHAKVATPLWIPFVLIALPTAYLWKQDLVAARRVRAGLCRKCKYDRSGLSPSAPCPECNAATSPERK